MGRTRHRAVASAALLPLLVLVACGGPVEVESPELDGDDAAACERFAAALPDTLVDLARVDVEPADAPAAAYGDPPVVVTCGVSAPEGFGAGVQCEVVNDVPWYIPIEQYDDMGLDLVITAAWHRPRVEVLLPAEHRGAEGGVMAVLSPLVEEHLRATATCEL